MSDASAPAKTFSLTIRAASACAAAPPAAIFANLSAMTCCASTANAADSSAKENQV